MALNPSARQPVILAAGTPQILLPWDNAKAFEERLSGYDGRLASWTVWVAPSTLKPADAAKKVGMSEAELRRVNNIPPRVVIKAGSSLLVPRPLQLGNDVASHVADHGQLNLAPELTLKRSSVKAGKAETVASVAKRYRLSPATVAEWNQVSVTANFKPGQAVVLYLPAGSKPTKQVAKSKTRAPSATKPSSGPKPSSKR